MHILKGFQKTAFFSLVFMLIFTWPIQAITVSPSSGSKQTNTTATLSLYANPVAGEDTVKIDLAFTNITVLGFSAASLPFVFGECTGGAQYTSSHVCVTLAQDSGDFTSNQLLGTVSVRWGSVGTASIVATDNNVYVGSASVDGLRINAGTKATYTIGTLPATPLIEKTVDKYLLIGSGLALISIGLYLKKKTEKQTTSNYEGSNY